MANAPTPTAGTDEWDSKAPLPDFSKPVTPTVNSNPGFMSRAWASVKSHTIEPVENFFSSMGTGISNTASSVKDSVVSAAKKAGVTAEKVKDTAEVSAMGAAAGYLLDDKEGAMFGTIAGGIMGFLGVGKGDTAKAIGIGALVDGVLQKFGGLDKTTGLIFGVLAAGAVAILGFDRIGSLFGLAKDKLTASVDSIIKPEAPGMKMAALPTPGH